MTPTLRTMPVVYARAQADGRWSVGLPGGVTRIAASRAAVGRLVRREAPGSAVAFSVPHTEDKPPR